MHCLKVEFNAYKSQTATGTVVAGPRIEVPRPEVYGRARKARDIKNFLYGVEQYFNALGILDDATKLRTAALYLKDTALVW
jgi:hypothetical protein